MKGHKVTTIAKAGNWTLCRCQLCRQPYQLKTGPPKHERIVKFFDSRAEAVQAFEKETRGSR
ncbi:MAG: hypothetical protein AB7R89_16325 [Dehalococcoidia bacterium]